MSEAIIVTIFETVGVNGEVELVEDSEPLLFVVQVYVIPFDQTCILIG